MGTDVRQTLLQIPVQAQRDKRWRNETLGNDPQATIGDYGCLITSFSMLANSTPSIVNQWMRANGKFQSGDCQACAATFDVPGPMGGYRFVDATDRCETLPFPDYGIRGLTEWLKTGKPAILEVDMQPNLVGHQMHFVLAVAAFGDPIDGNIIINDPWFEDQTTLVPRYGNNLARCLVRAVFYE